MANTQTPTRYKINNRSRANLLIFSKISAMKTSAEKMKIVITIA